jgi:hypothetical protein
LDSKGVLRKRSSQAKEERMTKRKDNHIRKTEKASYSVVFAEPKKSEIIERE